MRTDAEDFVHQIFGTNYAEFAFRKSINKKFRLVILAAVSVALIIYVYIYLKYVYFFLIWYGRTSFLVVEF